MVKSNINLGHFIENENKSDAANNRIRQVQELLGNLPLGTSFEIRFQENFGNYGFFYGDTFVAAPSKAFCDEKIQAMAKIGYTPVAAKLSQVCHWQSETGRSAWVPLFQVLFR